MVCVFARKTSEPLTSLVKQIDKKIGENSKPEELRRHHDAKMADKTGEALKKLAKEAGVKNVPLTMIGEIDGPPDYEISKDSDITVLLWKHARGQVQSWIQGRVE